MLKNNRNSFWAKIAFLIGFIFVLDVGAHFCVRFLTGKSLSVIRVARIRSAADANDFKQGNGELKSYLRTEVVHPYLGYVLDPNQNENVCEFGFKSAGDRIVKRSRDTLLVGIFGGSFAEGLSSGASDVLAKRLKRIPAYSGKKIQVLNFSVAGYKQPQQYMALSYLLFLGGELDVVINLDGLNEMTLPAMENIPKGVHPAFPRSWFFRVGKIAGPSMLENITELNAIMKKRASWARFVDRPVIRDSAICVALWSLRDYLLVRRMGSIQMEMSGLRSYVSTGPKYNFSDEKDLYRELGKLWLGGSLQMERVCKANGIRYFHFLQPNQYVPGSKPFSDAEKQAATTNEWGFAHGVQQGYPVLRELIDHEKEIPVYDLTEIYSQMNETIYIDPCCHSNLKGYQVVAAKIGDVIAKSGRN